MDELLHLLQRNARETLENLAKILDSSAEDVRARIVEYERLGVIRGYQAIVNEECAEADKVIAVIEVKVTPEREHGFNQIADCISKFSEVQSLFLMSGAFDLLLFVTGSDMKAVARFVSEKLATIRGVVSTSTHFMLKTYKDHGLLMEAPHAVERLKVSP
ncbi:MAG: Lrp/AsnC family transcriptional regulator [Kiritimatiellae bacterium]|nr:Lrp/AsnC family transcriptional regulator [Kiritimatiellia bacterium]